MHRICVGIVCVENKLDLDVCLYKYGISGSDDVGERVKRTIFE